ncbi:hypothetical protein N9L68_06400 [bacterium]|nr:hypothetical protein [bacterium]
MAGQDLVQGWREFAQLMLDYMTERDEEALRSLTAKDLDMKTDVTERDLFEGSALAQPRMQGGRSKWGDTMKAVVVGGVERSEKRRRLTREAEGLPPVQPGSAEDHRAAAEDLVFEWMGQLRQLSQLEQQMDVSPGTGSAERPPPLARWESGRHRRRRGVPRLGGMSPSRLPRTTPTSARVWQPRFRLEWLPRGPEDPWRHS